MIGATVDDGHPAATSVVSGPRASIASAADPQAGDATAALLTAMQSFPLVAIGERHGIQQMYDFVNALLHHPETAGRITDVVVEFGNSLHQDIADRFILTDQRVTNTDLVRIWRFTIGGGVLWDSPMYAELFHTVRALNQTLPVGRRIRVLLGDSPFDHRRVRGPHDKQYLLAALRRRDANYAAVVEREVLAKGRRALLRTPGSKDPRLSRYLRVLTDLRPANDRIRSTFGSPSGQYAMPRESVTGAVPLFPEDVVGGPA
jgi:hypothetical protein